MTFSCCRSCSRAASRSRLGLLSRQPRGRRVRGVLFGEPLRFVGLRLRRCPRGVGFRPRPLEVRFRPFRREPLALCRRPRRFRLGTLTFGQRSFAIEPRALVFRLAPTIFFGAQPGCRVSSR